MLDRDKTHTVFKFRGDRQREGFSFLPFSTTKDYYFSHPCPFLRVLHVLPIYHLSGLHNRDTIKARFGIRNLKPIKTCAGQWKGVRMSEVYSPDIIYMFQIIQSESPTFKKSGKTNGFIQNT